MGRIAAREVCVDFPVFTNSSRSMKNLVLRATTGGRIARDAGQHSYVRSLDHVSFDIAAGERVALVGHNGSGKTTLLRTLCGVYAPTHGRLTVSGRVVSLLDINLGMDPDGTGFENIMMRGIVMGMTPKQINSRIDDIAEFTDLGEYLAMPIRTYSSGMQMRLAFAVSTSVDADVLLMDEWLAVGDAEFQDKAARRLAVMLDRTPILVIATHSTDLVNKTCTRVIRLEHGRISSDEPVPQAIAAETVTQ
jgi:lipopolysaccharide transport system ATP-binding protein